MITYIYTDTYTHTYIQSLFYGRKSASNQTIFPKEKSAKGSLNGFKVLDMKNGKVKKSYSEQLVHLSKSAFK